MKTITEFSGILLRQAAEAQQAFRAAHPQAEEQPAAAAQPAAEAAPAADVPEEPVAETPPDAGPAAQDAASAAADAGGEPASDPVAEPAVEAAAPDLGTGPEAEAVAEAMQIRGDRLSRLMEALAVVGKRAAGVRLVRVLSGENPPANAQKKGDFYYVVDAMPRPESRRDVDSRGDERRGRDRDGRGGGRGPVGPGGGRGPVGFGGRGGGFNALARDADLPRGDLAKGGEGWMLTRAPDERRGGNRGPVDPTRREQPGRPPRGPRFDGRGPRPPGERPAGDRSPGNRAPRGDRPSFGDRPPRGDRPRFGDRPRAGREGVSTQPPGPGSEATRAAGPGSDQRPRRNSGEDHRRGQGWSGPVRRRGGWDEPMVVEAGSAPDVVAVPPQREATPTAPDSAPAPAVESAEGEKK